MLNTILRSIQTGIPKSIPNWDKTVMTIKLRTEIVRSRYLQTGFVYNTGSNLLKSILESVITSNPTILDYTSDFKCYVEIVDPSVAVYRNYFDPVYNSKMSKGVFTWQPNVPEYILNVSMDRPLMKLPLDQPWEFWKDLTPVHVIYHDSRELVTNLYQMRVKFKKDPPHVVFYSIDLVMLIFMYLKYIKYMRSIGEVAQIEDFLQEFVFVKWFDDLRRIWLFNILKDAVHNDFSFIRFKADEMVAPNPILRTCTMDLYRLLDDARKHSVSLGDICATKWFGDTSLTDWLVELSTNLQVPPLRQYTWLKFAGTLPYVVFMLDTLLLIGRNDINPIVRSFIFELHQYQNQNICLNIQNLKYRAYVQKELDTIIQRIEDMRYL